jgi:hypothetical protein
MRRRVPQRSKAAGSGRPSFQDTIKRAINTTARIRSSKKAASLYAPLNQSGPKAPIRSVMIVTKKRRKAPSRCGLTRAAGSGGLVSSRPRAAERLKAIGKLSESSLSRCPKTTTVALKQENAFARQTAAKAARTDGRGSYWPKLGSCWQGARRSIEQYRRITVKIS